MIYKKVHIQFINIRYNTTIKRAKKQKSRETEKQRSREVRENKMSKLQLKEIRKAYKTGDTTVEALKGISLEFRENEFVSILGQSGCGKTTFLNIIGGLDKYDNGDLVINGLSTKNYKDRDWDAYRNKSIGFVFQNYNLIGHQTVLQNVEIAMTLSGVPASVRKQRAQEALKAVQLEDQMKKRPNQLSGGQMQRVAIARALVNNPDIILADEPTGALDSKTSIQVMDILKEISKTRLVIMVTHNGELAETYSNRIIRLLDGNIQSDTNPFIQNENEKIKVTEKIKQTSMSLMTATALSFKNLLTKKGRTTITAFAGSIGIIGVALVLALSNGLSDYMGTFQAETLSGYPISVSTSEQSIDFNDRPAFAQKEKTSTNEKFPTEETIVRYNSEENKKAHTNVLTDEFLTYVGNIETDLPGSINTISYSRGLEINVLTKAEDTVIKYETTKESGSAMRELMAGGNTYWQELPANNDFTLSMYDLIGEGSLLPQSANEIAIVVDEYNRIDEEFFQKIGMFTESDKQNFTDFIGQTFMKAIPNDAYYTEQENGAFVAATTTEYEDLFVNADGVELKVTGILRIKDGATSKYLSTGIAYTTALTDYLVTNAENSAIARVQNDSDRDVLRNIPFRNDQMRSQQLSSLGATTMPTGISIYPTDFTQKDKIKEHIDAFNEGRATEDQIIYTDLGETVASSMSTLLNTITYILIGFAAISLIVSTIMIGIITYVSVIERTKEIGILRSVGARKKDISRVFNAETLIIGFVAGLLGVGLSYLVSIPINAVVLQLTGVANIASLNPIHALLLLIGSMTLTLIAGLIPARMAAKKDPVIALRTE